MGANEKHDATFHPQDGPNRDAIEELDEWLALPENQDPDDLAVHLTRSLRDFMAMRRGERRALAGERVDQHSIRRYPPVDPDIIDAVDAMQPESVAQRVAMERTLQNRRDGQ